MMEGHAAARAAAAADLRGARRTLRATFDVRDVQLDDDIDVLIVAEADDLDEAAAGSLDQFVMKGGAAIVLDGRYRIDLMGSSRGGLVVEQVTTGLEDLLSRTGGDRPARAGARSRKQASPSRSSATSVAA
ncbi:MAG: Gldg family protein [Kofleriaceae bacterium]